MTGNPEKRFNGQAMPKQTLYRFSGDSVLVVLNALDQETIRAMLGEQAPDIGSLIS
ncbi:hypothetical protein [Altererythrobacter sp. GH1-8]|jgi:hypothetical protein|uniref:hypothetical protein n=1 Tax=Altererythrobacter sp. GH1-8 TaxID=3349333 RepID=UPI00374DB27B